MSARCMSSVLIAFVWLSLFTLQAFSTLFMTRHKVCLK